MYIICRRAKGSNGLVSTLKRKPFGSYIDWSWIAYQPWSGQDAYVFNEAPVELAKRYKGFIVKVCSPKCPLEIYNPKVTPLKANANNKFVVKRSRNPLTSKKK